MINKTLSEALMPSNAGKKLCKPGGSAWATAAKSSFAGFDALDEMLLENVDYFIPANSLWRRL